MESPLSFLAMWRLPAGIAVLAALLAWESWRPYFGFFKSGQTSRGRHMARNLSMGLLNGLLVAAGFAAVWAGVAEWAATHRVGLLHRLAPPTWAHAAGAVLLLDLWTYAWHRANHRLPWLWRFHRVHHADPHMDVTTAQRFHPGEIAMSSALRVPLIALLGVHLWELVLYELLMAAVVAFHHANVGLPAAVDRALRAVIVTPAMHKVHHSREQPETDSNYTSLLSVWDRVFRTFRLRDDPSTIQFGLDRWTPPRYRDTLPRMLTTPFRSGPSE